MQQQATTTREIAGIIGQTTDATRQVASRMAQVSGETTATEARLTEVRQDAVDAGAAVAELTRTMVRVVRDATASAAERRAAPRRKISADAVLTLPGAPDIPGKVEDLSAQGIALRTAAALAPGDRLSIAVPEFGIGGTARLQVVQVEDGLVRGRLEGLDAAMQDRLTARLAA